MSTDLSTPRQTQAERRQQSKDRLLAAGVEVIAEQGFARTTLAQIGERAGYSRETVRLRHGTKLELLETAMTGYDTRVFAPTQDDTLDGLSQVLAINDALAQLARKEATLLRVVYRVYLESLSTLPELHEHAVRWVDESEAAVFASLQRGKKDGSVRADVDCAEAAFEWLNTAIGLAYRYLQRPEQDHAAALEAWKERLRRQLSP